MYGRLEEEESRRIVLHLVPGCPRCQEITSELWWAAAGRGGEAAAAIDYGPCVRRVFDRVRRVRAELEVEQAGAPGELLEWRYVLAELTCQSPVRISANPSPSIQPNLSPRRATASSTATSGWSVP